MPREIPRLGPLSKHPLKEFPKRARGGFLGGFWRERFHVFATFVFISFPRFFLLRERFEEAKYGSQDADEERQILDSCERRNKEEQPDEVRPFVQPVQTERDGNKKIGDISPEKRLHNFDYGGGQSARNLVPRGVERPKRRGGRNYQKHYFWCHELRFRSECVLVEGVQLMSFPPRRDGGLLFLLRLLPSIRGLSRLAGRL